MCKVSASTFCCMSWNWVWHTIKCNSTDFTCLMCISSIHLFPAHTLKYKGECIYTLKIWGRACTSSIHIFPIHTLKYKGEYIYTLKTWGRACISSIHIFPTHTLKYKGEYIHTLKIWGLLYETRLNHERHDAIMKIQTYVYIHFMELDWFDTSCSMCWWCSTSWLAPKKRTKSRLNIRVCMRHETRWGRHRLQHVLVVLNPFSGAKKGRQIWKNIVEPLFQQVQICACVCLRKEQWCGWWWDLL